MSASVAGNSIVFCGRVKPEALAREVERGWNSQAQRRLPKAVKFSVIKTHLSVGFARTRDTRTPYAVDATGGGRSSAIIRKTSANRVL
jgi:hypothetical protein